MEHYSFWPGFVFWAGFAAWFTLAVILALALYRLHRERTSPTDSVEVQLAAFLRIAGTRIVTWVAGFIGAVLPNLSGLTEGICGAAVACRSTTASFGGQSGFVALSYVNTAASIALVTAITTLLGLAGLAHRAKTSQSVLTWIGTALLVVTVLAVAAYFTWLSNVTETGVAMSQAWFWFMLWTSVVVSIGAEAWMAHAAVIDRRQGQ